MSAMKYSSPALAEQDPRWLALISRDPSSDGSFVYAVATTGVYCRPSCPSRLARPENVRFFDSCREAESAGFRACKRCHPSRDSLSEIHAAKIAASCRTIENALDEADEPPSLAILAAQAELSAFHFHRLFKAITGVTPKAYARAHRAGLVRETLRRSQTVTAALYDAGFNSSGRFYAESGKILGMTPGQYRAGGETLSISFAIGKSSLGDVLVACSDVGICAILLGDDPNELRQELRRRFPRAALTGGEGEFERTVAQVIALVDRPELPHDLPLDIRGTAFQQRVWQALRTIPIGHTASYSQIAALIGTPKAVRAVAAACAANPLAVAVPCHRVVRTDGSLAGYRWGIERKKRLLQCEKAR
jgi:AraC family transcriptional regulator of adaptative response/methylated-DNA-[protein]-cysteine methyltransferase